jgi:hypothetical protein
VTGAVCGMRRTADGFARYVVGVAAERSLRDFAIGGAVKRQAHVFQFKDGFGRFLAHKLDGILIAHIVRAFDRVVGVPFHAVFFEIAQRCTDAALRRACVRARRIKFADDRRLCSARCVQTCHETRASRSDDNHVKLM